ncbi:MAG: hypothetical protein M3081_00800 [Gemmatimonadota bacterium]|nr:hypothetical protein [Gemmatimonadota bacterium]
MLRRWVVLGVLALAACTNRSDVIVGTGSVPAPTNLTYELVPSGNAAFPDGIILRWDAPADSRINSFVIYSRGSTAGSWGRRAETTSQSFHDAGVPHLQYYVTSADANGNESSPSNSITVDATKQLSPPGGLATVTLNRAIQISWSPGVRQGSPTIFDYYRVYSMPYNLDTGVCDGVHEALEGTTVSEDFLATGLTNGVPRCFVVTTVSRDGHESVNSSARVDTPRFDSRNILVNAMQAAGATSGFRFYSAASQLGVVTNGSATDNDFFLDRRGDGSVWITPVRSGTRIALYSTKPVADLTSIDIAPVSGFSTGAIEAVSGYLYVFETRLTDGLHYGAIRVTHTTRDYMIFDWSYQTDPGNPMLNRVPSPVSASN